MRVEAEMTAITYKANDISIQALLGCRVETLLISEVVGRAEFMQLEGEWNALVRRTRDEPFYRHEFIRVWVDNFAHGDKLRVLTGRDAGGKLVAALPLVESRTTMLGAPVRLLASPANDHTPRFDMLAEDGLEAGQAFYNYLAGDPSWDVLRLNNVPHAGHAWRLYDAAADAGNPVGLWESLQSPYIPLPQTVDELSGRLGSKFRANLRRRRRKLEGMGQVTVERVTGGPDMPFHLEEGLALEQSGWKGRDGTAIAQSSALWGYYSELARFAAYDGCLSLFLMRLDGVPVAFQYGLRYGSTYYLLKPAYSEAVRECSPGQLLMDSVVKLCIEGKLTEFDFLGPDMDWKRDWTDATRRHVWLYVFRDTAYGRFLHNYKFRWARGAATVARKWLKV